MNRFVRSTIRHASAAALAAAALGAAPAAFAQAKAAAEKPWAGIGRPATTSEIKAWDIDVRADFKGLPPGSGSVSLGQDVWEAKCASCHGTFGESNEVFTPIVGGTTKEDVKTGRVANLARPDYPQRTTMMKVSQLSTLWDYINRAMPWNAPKSLKPDEVYGVVAYILNLADVVPEDFVLSDKNMAEVQNRLPNRNGKLFWEGLWSVKGKPDVQGDACMSNCKTAMDIRSILPEFARNAHGNLAEQNRVVGPTRGADTTQPALKEPYKVAAAKAAPAAAAAPKAKGPLDLAKESNCTACHGVDNKMVGPSFREVAAKYKGDAKAAEVLFGRVKNGGQGVWGQIPMPANSGVADEDIRAMVKWILEGAN